MRILSLFFSEKKILVFSFRIRRLDIPLVSWGRGGRGRREALGVQGRRSTSSFKCVREAVL